MAALSSDVTVRGRCKTCGYLLVGLLDPRCPECGRPFDPSDPSTMGFPRPWTRWFTCALDQLRAFWRRSARYRPAAIAIAISWLLYNWHEGLLSLFFAVPVVYLLFRRRWRSAAAFLVLNPFSVFLAADIVGYARGSSRFVFSGMEILREQSSIDPVTRVRSWSSDCGTRPANQWLHTVTGRTAIVLLYPVIGPPPGAYRGPYPTRAEAAQALQSSIPLTIPRNWNGRIGLPTGAIRVDPEWFYYRDWGLDEKTGPMRISLWKQRCLLVQIPRIERSGRWLEVHLLDALSTRPFALYCLPWPDADASAQHH